MNSYVAYALFCIKPSNHVQYLKPERLRHVYLVRQNIFDDLQVNHHDAHTAFFSFRACDRSLTYDIVTAFAEEAPVNGLAGTVTVAKTIYYCGVFPSNVQCLLVHEIIA